MITQRTSINKDEYDKLFEDALEALQQSVDSPYQEIQLSIDTYQPNMYYVQGSDGQYTLAIGEFEDTKTYFQQIVPTSLTTLPQYFSQLETLGALNTKYLRLPLDEPYFKINANTRGIEIPDDFKKNGVGVQGDHGAEILCFRINRFFDAMDFGRDDARIIIQWKTTDKENPTGSSVAIYKDIETDPDFVFFGWELNDNITKAGVVQFSIRILFWENNSPTSGPYIYSFSTLPATVAIQSTLQLAGDFLTPNESVESNILNRIKNSPTPSSLLKLLPPIFVYPTNAEKTEEINLIKDENGEYKFVLKACAYPNPQGLVNYRWYKDNKKLTSTESLQKDDAFVELLYKDDYNQNITYYKINEKGKYVVHPIDDFDDDVQIDKDGVFVPRLFYKEGYRTINTAGTYTVEAWCSGGNYLVSEPTINKFKWYVPGPEAIVLSSEDMYQIIQMDIGTTISPINLINNKDNYHAFEYNWTLNDNQETLSDNESFVINIITNDSPEEKRNKQGVYHVAIKGIKNNVTSDEAVTKDYIVLLPAQIPVPGVLINGITPNSFDANKNNQFEITLFTPGQDDNYQLAEYTHFNYTWYKAGKIPLEFNSILTNNNLSLADKNNALQAELDSVGAEVIGTNGSKFTPSDSGYYCCKITNVYGPETNSCSYYTPLYTVV